MVNFNISEYFRDFNTQNGRGFCIACDKEVGWSRERVAAHKRGSCPNVTVQESKFFRKRKTFSNVQCSDDSSNDKSKNMRRFYSKTALDISYLLLEESFQIIEYLCDFNKKNHRGACITCGKLVGWSRERVAAHKRRNCKEMTAEERKLFRKRKLAHEKAKPDDDSSGDEQSRDSKVNLKGRK